MKIVYRMSYIVFGLTILFVLPIYNIPYTKYEIHAVDASPSATPDPIKSKIEEFKKEIASRAANLKMEVNKKLENKAYIGKITEVSSSKIVIETNKGSKTVIINEYTTFQSSNQKIQPNSTTKQSKALTIKDFAKDDYIVSLGDNDDQNNQIAKKIIKLSQYKVSEKKIIWGQIQSITPGNLTIKDKEEKKITINTLPTTIYRIASQEAVLDDVKMNQFIITSGLMDKNNNLQSQFIYIIPTGAVMTPKKSASPSASVKPAKTASPSAKPKN